MERRKGTSRENAERDLPILQNRLDETALLCDSVSAQAVGFHDSDRYGFMLLSFSGRLLGHARSLLDLGDSRDTSLVARSMVEGLAQIIYAARDPEARGRRWWAYSAISRLRFAERGLKLGLAEPDEGALEELRRQAREVGDQFLTPAAIKARNRGKPMPSNPYVPSWYGMRIDELFVEVEGRRLYDGVYRSFSGWHHFDPFYIGIALEERPNDEIAYAHRDPVIACQAAAAGIQALLQAHTLLAEHFRLDGSELKTAEEDFIAWHKERAT